MLRFDQLRKTNQEQISIQFETNTDTIERGLMCKEIDQDLILRFIEIYGPIAPRKAEADSPLSPRNTRIAINHLIAMDKVWINDDLKLEITGENNVF